MHKSLLCIDSKHRDRSIHPDSDGFRVTFPTKSSVVAVELASTCLPNVGPVVSRYNDRLSWQDAGDSRVHSTTIPHGNYTACGLAQALMEAMCEEGESARQFQVTSMAITSTMLIEQFVERKLRVSLSVTENSTEVEVALPDHGLSPGDTITVEGAASVSGIPSSRINGEQLVTRTERDSLFFGVPFAASCSATGRDGCVTIATATPFRLVFDTPDSMGALLGFVESDHTDYKPAHISENYMNLAGPDHCYLCSPQLGGQVTTTGSHPDVFAVLLLTSPPGTVMFNAFCAETKSFDAPTELSFLDFRVVDAEGRPFNLGGQDFSLTLRLTCQP